MKVDASQRWTGDDINVVKIGLGYIKYMECDNERDKWWKGRKGYQTAFEYAANLSAFYDGHKNTMGAGVGVKNADSTMLVVMAGLASADADYVRGMIEWCRQNRGYKADGSVNLCWDIINYHLYSNDSKSSQSGTPTRGVAPELSEAGQVANEFLLLAHQYAKDMPVWITEAGYDANQGSPYKAIPIGSKNEYATQADWILRTSLLYARAGIEKCFFYEMYDDNFLNPTQFASSGLINQDKTRKPAADFVYQFSKMMGSYSYGETLNADPIVDRYEQAGKSVYIVYVPDEVGRTVAYQLNLGTADSVLICTPQIGSNALKIKSARTTNGKLNLTATETPTLVIPTTFKSANRTSQDWSSLSMPDSATAAKVERDYPLSLYPNPTNGFVTLNINGDENCNTEISIIEAATGY